MLNVFWSYKEKGRQTDSTWNMSRNPRIRRSKELKGLVRGASNIVLLNKVKYAL